MHDYSDMYEYAYTSYAYACNEQFEDKLSDDNQTAYRCAAVDGCKKKSLFNVCCLLKDTLCCNGFSRLQIIENLKK
jgi:hypothetical protein